MHEYCLGIMMCFAMKDIFLKKTPCILIIGIIVLILPFSLFATSLEIAAFTIITILIVPGFSEIPISCTKEETLYLFDFITCSFERYPSNFGTGLLSQYPLSAMMENEKRFQVVNEIMNKILNYLRQFT